MSWTFFVLVLISDAQMSYTGLEFKSYPIPVTTMPKFEVTNFTPFTFSGPEPSNYSWVRQFPDESAWKCKFTKNEEVEKFMESGEVLKEDIDNFIR